jgi:hypothetical protein
VCIHRYNSRYWPHPRTIARSPPLLSWAVRLLQTESRSGWTRVSSKG